MIKVCTVARDGARTAKVGNFNFPIWTGATYGIHRRKDGEYIWRRVGSFGRTASGMRPSRKLIADLRLCAPYYWIDKNVNVTHNKHISQSLLLYLLRTIKNDN